MLPLATGVTLLIRLISLHLSIRYLRKKITEKKNNNCISADFGRRAMRSGQFKFSVSLGILPLDERRVRLRAANADRDVIPNPEGGRPK